MRRRDDQWVSELRERSRVRREAGVDEWKYERTSGVSSNVTVPLGVDTRRRPRSRGREDRWPFSPSNGTRDHATPRRARTARSGARDRSSPPRAGRRVAARGRFRRARDRGRGRGRASTRRPRSRTHASSNGRSWTSADARVDAACRGQLDHSRETSIATTSAASSRACARRAHPHRSRPRARDAGVSRPRPGRRGLGRPARRLPVRARRPASPVSLAYCARTCAGSSSAHSSIEAARQALPRRLPTEPRVHGRTDVRELALLVDPPGCVAPRRVREQERVLARVIRRRRRRIAAVIRRDDSRSPGCSASRMSGRRRSKSCRQRWKFTGSFR